VNKAIEKRLIDDDFQYKLRKGQYHKLKCTPYTLQWFIRHICWKSCRFIWWFL